jgi:hypothetical protein
MYNQCLITPTILDSYEFAANAPHNWKVKAETGFLAKLRREKVDYPKWVDKGLAFEDTIYRVCNAHRNDEPVTQGSEYFRRACNECLGGVFQSKLSKTITIDGQKVFLFGYSDVIHYPEGLIIDIKTTLKYKGPEKYLNGHQHLIYPYVTGLPNFKYLIAQWQDEYSDTIQAVHSVPYRVDDFEKLEKTLTEKVTNFFNYLRENNLWLDYYTIFSKN